MQPSLRRLYNKLSTYSTKTSKPSLLTKPLSSSLR